MSQITIDTTEMRGCRKCGKLTKVFRHHMGNDGLLSVFSYTIRRDYSLYKDCVDLCDDCHMKIHWVYDRHIAKHPLGRRVAKGETEIQKVRQEFIDLCKAWLRGGGKFPKRPSAVFRKLWQTNPYYQKPLSSRTKGSRGTG